jgi:hypothetical protein
MATTHWLLGCAVVLSGCSGAQTDAANPEGGAGDGDGADAIPVTPQKEPPEGLSDDDKKELGALCNPIEPEMYDAGKQAVATLQEELAKGTASEAAEKAGLAAGVAMLREKAKGLDGTDMNRCVALFEKGTKRRLFDHEPTEQVARDAVDTCVKRVVATAGKRDMAYDMGGTGTGTSAEGPFCPEDDPVPKTLKELPYKSKAADWDTPTWQCLGFGLRAAQAFQIEYAAPYGTNEFACTARFPPRQGGAPIELTRGGRVSAEGELQLDKKIEKRRMKP